MTINAKIFIAVVIGGVVSGLAFSVLKEINDMKDKKRYAEIDREWDKFVSETLEQPEL